MNPRLSIAHIPMFISLLDRLIRNIWWDHKKWWKITKMCDFRKIHEKSNPQMKNDQISKKSKIRLKCRMKFIFSCWLGWGIVFFKKIILEPLGHILRSIRNIWWDHEKWWKIVKMTGFQRSAPNWRPRARIFENFELSPFYRTFSHIYSLLRSFDTQSTADARNHP